MNEEVKYISYEEALSVYAKMTKVSHPYKIGLFQI